MRYSSSVGLGRPSSLSGRWDEGEVCRRITSQSVGHDDAEAWKVVILNDEHDAQMILPFSVSQAFKAQRRRAE
jgi:hypothetical protein